MGFDKRYLRGILLVVAFAVLLLAAAWNLGAVWEAVCWAARMVSFLAMGFALAFILNTPLRLIERGPLMCALPPKWKKVKRPLALALSVLVALGIVLLAVFLVIPELIQTFVVLGEQVPAFFDGVSAWVQRFMDDTSKMQRAVQMPPLDWVKIGDAALDFLRSGAGSLVTDTVTMATSVVSGIINAVLAIVIACYVLMQKERLAGQVKRVLYAYLPEKRTDRIVSVARMASLTFQRYIAVQVLEAIILGVLCFLGMTVCGFSFAPMVSVLVGVLALLPIVGGFIGFVVGAFLILVNQGGVIALWFCIFILVLQQIEGNFIYPRVVGKRVMLPGLWVLSAAVLGGNLAGIAGMLVSVPLASLLYALLREHVERRNKESGIDFSRK